MHCNKSLVRLRWTPWDNCSYPAILDYPNPGFPDGVPTIVLAALTLLTCCLLLARICDHYFLPAVKLVADRWGLKGDVVNAVIFASAASWPELAISVITIFETGQPGVGVGTIVGTSVFNTLAVPALCSFFYNKGAPVNPVTTTRDTAMSAIALLLLGLALKDNSIGWWNASIMLILYALYVIGLGSFSVKEPLSWEENYEKCNLLRGASKFYVQPRCLATEEDAARKHSSSDDGGTMIRLQELRFNKGSTVQYMSIESYSAQKVTCWSRVKWVLKMLLDAFLWPFHNFLRLVIPPHERFPYLAILLGMVYISVITYVVCWMITTLGYKSNIPNSLLSLTVLSVGLGYPDLISSLKVAKEGTVSDALSNAMGANTFNILICLGLPWFIRSVTLLGEGGGEIFLNLDGVTYSINIMFSVLLMFYATLIANGFIFNAKVGCICIAIYIFFVVTMALVEFNVFFPVNKPLCNIKDFYNDPS